MSSYELRVGDNLEVLKTLEDESVDCIVTSPPYWGLRDYQTGIWEGGNPECSHQRDSKKSKSNFTNQDDVIGNIGDGIYKKVCPRCGAVRIDKQVGLEETPSEYINRLVTIFNECKRVMKPTGTLWINIGDTYVSGKKTEGIKPKDMIGIPWMLAFKLRENGFYLRNDIIWLKVNTKPESVKDRCTCSHEHIFLFSKSSKYYFDYEAIQEKSKTFSSTIRNRKAEKINNTPGQTPQGNLCKNNYEFRRKRDVWAVPIANYKGSHFATFNKSLIEPCILAGCPEGGTVLDPFAGSGTTGEVAIRKNRKAILIDLNPDYCNLIKNRLDNLKPETVKKPKTMFTQPELFGDMFESEEEQPEEETQMEFNLFSDVVSM